MGGNGGGFTAVWGFWQGFTMQKAKVSDIPRGWGPWLQMTGAQLGRFLPDKQAATPLIDHTAHQTLSSKF